LRRRGKSDEGSSVVGRCQKRGILDRFSPGSLLDSPHIHPIQLVIGRHTFNLLRMKFSNACLTLHTTWLLLHLGLGLLLLLLLLLPRLLLLLNGSHILLLLSRPGVLLLCCWLLLLLLLEWFLIWLLRRPLLGSSLGICLIGLRALGLLCYLTSWGSLSIP